MRYAIFTALLLLAIGWRIVYKARTPPAGNIGMILFIAGIVVAFSCAAFAIFRCVA